jgi:hypothetical protein
MWTDSIVAELHRLRERHARAFSYDLRRMFQDLKKQQESCGRRVVSPPRKRTAPWARVKS